MSPHAVQVLLQDDLGAGWHGETVNGVRLSEAICAPALITIVDALTGMTVNAWAVAYEDPEHKEGFLVAYDPDLKQFVLAEHAPEGPPYIISHHHTIRAAIEAM